MTFDLCAWCQPLTTNFNNLSSVSLEPTDPKENKGHKWHSLYIWLRARIFLGPLFLFFFYSGVCVAFLTKVSVSVALRGFPDRIQKVAFTAFESSATSLAQVEQLIVNCLSASGKLDGP